MRFRAWLFTALWIIALIWLFGGIALSIGSAHSTAANVPADITYTNAYKAGADVGGIILASMFICTGLPALVFFSFVSWRCRVGIRAEQKHQEMLIAMNGRG